MVIFHGHVSHNQMVLVDIPTVARLWGTEKLIPLWLRWTTVARRWSNADSMFSDQTSLNVQHQVSPWLSFRTTNGVSELYVSNPQKDTLDFRYLKTIISHTSQDLEPVLNLSWCPFLTCRFCFPSIVTGWSFHRRVSSHVPGRHHRAVQWISAVEHCDATTWGIAMGAMGIGPGVIKHG
jgi:hypothetical protein